METLGDLPILLFEDENSWRQWLDTNYPQQTGIWLKIAKKASGLPSVSYADAVDNALCYGWIDATKQKYDEQYYLQMFSPRRPKSIWSKVNVGKIEALTAAGRMMPPGLAAVAAAKADGRWDDAYDSHSTMEVPADFQVELDSHPKAKEFYATLNKTNTYAFLWRLQTTKNLDNRQAKIAKYIAMLEAGEVPHIFKPKP